MTTTFDKATHEYKIGGVIVASVTQIIKEMGIIDAQYFTEYATTRGTYVHDSTVMIDNDSLDEAALSEPLRPYIEAYKLFRSQVDYKPVYIEHDLYDKALMFAGTPDRICEINGTPAVLDLKTSGPQAWHKAQTALYLHLTSVSNVKKCLARYSLYLSANGAFKLKRHQDDSDIPAALLLVSAHHAKRRFI